MDIGARKHRIILAIFFSVFIFYNVWYGILFLKKCRELVQHKCLAANLFFHFHEKKFLCENDFTKNLYFYCCLHSCWPGLTLEGSKSGSSSSSSPSSQSSSSSSSSSNSSSSRASPKKLKIFVKMQQFFRENKIY